MKKVTEENKMPDHNLNRELDGLLIKVDVNNQEAFLTEENKKWILGITEGF